MILTIENKNKANDFGVLELKYGLIKSRERNLLKDVIKHLKPQNANFFFDEFFKMAEVDYKKEIFAWCQKNATKFNAEKYEKTLDEQPKKSYIYSLRVENGMKEEIDLYGETFKDLEDSIIRSKNPKLILDFAKNFKIDENLFRNALEQEHPKVYLNYFDEHISSNPTIVNDDMQTYM